MIYSIFVGKEVEAQKGLPKFLRALVNRDRAQNAEFSDSCSLLCETSEHLRLKEGLE